MLHTKISNKKQYCANVLSHSVFWLLHKKSYLTQNGTNHNAIFTCDSAKRYLQLAALKNGYRKPEAYIQPEVWFTIFFENLSVTM